MSIQSKKYILVPFFIGVVSASLFFLIFFQNQPENQRQPQTEQQATHPIFKNPNSISFFDNGIQCASERELTAPLQAVCLNSVNKPILTLSYAENKKDLLLTDTLENTITIPGFWKVEVDLPICEFNAVSQGGKSGAVKCYTSNLNRTEERIWSFTFNEKNELDIWSECVTKQKSSSGERPVTVNLEQTCKRYTWPQ